MGTPLRVGPDEAYRKIKSGASLLVCAYENEEMCREMHLEGAIFLKEFESRLPSVSKSQEIIFYCG